MSLTVRKAVKDDAALILHFVTELAIYEKAEVEVFATEDTIQSSIFNDDSHVLILNIAFCLFVNREININILVNIL